MATVASVVASLNICSMCHQPMAPGTGIFPPGALATMPPVVLCQSCYSKQYGGTPMPAGSSSLFHALGMGQFQSLDSVPLSSFHPPMALGGPPPANLTITLDGRPLTALDSAIGGHIIGANIGSLVGHAKTGLVGGVSKTLSKVLGASSLLKQVLPMLGGSSSGGVLGSVLGKK